MLPLPLTIVAGMLKLGLVLLGCVGLIGVGALVMRSIHRRHDADDHTEAEGPRYRIDPGGVLLACVGGAAMAVGSFLPLDEPGSHFAQVQSNTLIQHGGWLLIALGGAGAWSAFRCYQAGSRSWGAATAGVVGLIVVLALAESKGLRTLYPVGANGRPNQAAPGRIVPLGIAVYVSGIGALLMALGGGIVLRAELDEGEDPALHDDEATKRCPDCAERVLTAARVCRHCGYRFDAPAHARSAEQSGHETASRHPDGSPSG